MKEEGKSFFQKATDDYYVNFENDTLYTLRLDINDAFGKYKINKQGEIEISPGMMTLVCCDSEFADKFGNMFPKMTGYFGKGDKLFFEGEGELVFEPSSDTSWHFFSPHPD